MGLIKTAMLAGAGMYVVNKFTQSRRDAPSQQDPNYNPRNSQQYIDNGVPQQQDYYTQPKQGGQQQQQQRVIPLEFTDRRSQKVPQQQQEGAQPQYRLTNDPNAPVPSYAYDTEGGYYYKANPRVVSAPAPQMPDSYNTTGSPPPQYHAYGQYRAEGFVEPDEIVSESEFGGVKNRRSGRRSGSGSGSAALLNTLMQNAGGLKDGKGKDLMNKFLK
ncbi:hypothetical protein PV04_09442, partial [Phialophora macrospora]